MTKTFSLALALVLALVTVSGRTASAQGRREIVAAQGQTFSIAVVGLHDEYYNGEPVAFSVAVAVADDGTTAKKPVALTLWVETPFGRAVLDDQVRRLAPGQTVTFGMSFAQVSPAGRPAPSLDTNPTEITVGLTGKLKSESLDVSKTIKIFPVDAR